MISTKITRQGIPQGDSKFEFGQGKFAHQKNALKALDDAFDYAIDQLKRKKATIQQAFLRMKWGALDRYLDPHKYEWTSNYGTCHNCFI